MTITFQQITREFYGIIYVIMSSPNNQREFHRPSFYKDALRDDPRESYE